MHIAFLLSSFFIVNIFCSQENLPDKKYIPRELSLSLLQKEIERKDHLNPTNPLQFREFLIDLQGYINSNFVIQNDGSILKALAQKENHFILNSPFYTNDDQGKTFPQQLLTHTHIGRNYVTIVEGLFKAGLIDSNIKDKSQKSIVHTITESASIHLLSCLFSYLSSKDLRQIIPGTTRMAWENIFQYSISIDDHHVKILMENLNPSYSDLKILENSDSMLMAQTNIEKAVKYGWIVWKRWWRNRMLGVALFAMATAIYQKYIR